MLKNKYFRYLVFGALVGVIYYNVSFMLSEFGGSKPASSQPVSRPADNPPAAQSLGSPAAEASEGDPSSRQSPPSDFLDQMLLKEWGRDPFFTAQELEEMANPAAPVEVVYTEIPAEEEEAEEELNLQMVLLSSRGNVAVINENPYREGDLVGAARVRQILADRVLLDSRRGPRTLMLYQGSIRVRRTPRGDL